MVAFDESETRIAPKHGVLHLRTSHDESRSLWVESLKVRFRQRHLQAAVTYGIRGTKRAGAFRPAATVASMAADGATFCGRAPGPTIHYACNLRSETPGGMSRSRSSWRQRALCVCQARPSNSGYDNKVSTAAAESEGR